MVDFARARANMVNAQLEPNGIHHEGLVAAYRAMPRQSLVDPSLATRIYMDEDLYLPGSQRFVLEPLIEARLLQEAIREPIRRAMILGAASMPTVSLLASFADQLYVPEPDSVLAGRAREIPNVVVIETSYREGYAREAPYDLIFVPGAFPSVPAILADQIAVGGRLLGIIRSTPAAMGKAVVVHKLANGHTDTTYIADASTPYLSGFEPAAEFVF